MDPREMSTPKLLPLHHPKHLVAKLEHIIATNNPFRKTHMAADSQNKTVLARELF